MNKSLNSDQTAGSSRETEDDIMRRTEDPQNKVTPEQEGEEPHVQGKQMNKSRNGRVVYRESDREVVQPDQGESPMEEGELNHDSAEAAGERKGENHTIATKNMAAKAMITMLYKAMVETDNSGTEGTSDAEPRIFADIPKDDKDQLDELKKSMDGIAKALGLAPVRKSQGGDNAVNKSLETLSQAVQQQGMVLKEILEGFGLGQQVTDDAFVGKSQDRAPARRNAPVAGYDNQDAVALLQNILGVRKAQEDEEMVGLPAVVGRNDVHKSAQAFLSLFGEDAGSTWGLRSVRK